MAIRIKQHNGNWRIHLEMEEWEFKTYKVFKIALDKILNLKQKQGQINNKINKK